jgi:hypothetical protein
MFFCVFLKYKHLFFIFSCCYPLPGVYGNVYYLFIRYFVFTPQEVEMIENVQALLKKTMDQAHEQLWWVNVWNWCSWNYFIFSSQFKKYTLRIQLRQPVMNSCQDMLFKRLFMTFKFILPFRNKKFSFVTNNFKIF